MALEVLSHYSDKNLKYDGSQLRSLFGYTEFGIEGDSVCGWRGPCNVRLDHMVDSEDKVQGLSIESDEMLHVIVELFHWQIHGGVVVQRLLSEQVKTLLLELTNESYTDFERRGDDLYFKQGKLNVSIATSSTHSVLIHYGINVTNKGTPIKTSSLEDFKVDVDSFAKKLLVNMSAELTSIERATRKVFGVN